MQEGLTFLGIRLHNFGLVYLMECFPCVVIKSGHGELLVSQWIFGICHVEKVYKIFWAIFVFCLVSCVYKAPNCSTNAFFDYLGDVLGSESRQGKEFIITGDINCNLLDESLAQI